GINTLLTCLREVYRDYLGLLLGHFGHSPQLVRVAYDLVVRCKPRGAAGPTAQRSNGLDAKYAHPELAALNQKVALWTLADLVTGSYSCCQQALAALTTRRDALRADVVPQVHALEDPPTLPAVARYAAAVARAIPAGEALV